MPPRSDAYRDASIRFRLRKEMQLLDQEVKGDGTLLLDIGIGAGDYLHAYLQRQLTVVALDKDPKGLCDLRYEFAGRSGSGFALVEGDAKWLPLRGNSVDIVFMCQLLEHLNDPLLALKEAFRVLRPGGSLFVDVPWWHELYRPLSAFLLRQLKQFKAKGKAPPFLRLFFKTQAGKARRRALTILPLKLLRLFPTFRGLDPEPFIEKYLEGKLEEGNLHLHFYFPSEWCSLVEEAGFRVEVVSGAWLAPPPFNRFTIFNSLFGRLEPCLGDGWLARISQKLIIKAIKLRSTV